ncbi:MAG: transglycosylase SLT domain-containing protein [Candidatus Eisenbacteria bacterium]|nr:transglycosylase SLT domain-containing protein [Candidatus Latescibacterota bacterium]MBD3302820.1 transglycosylase SLT domain-containing protein [Candidatus Eisenbacteria bacterium]
MGSTSEKDDLPPRADLPPAGRSLLRSPWVRWVLLALVLLFILLFFNPDRFSSWNARNEWISAFLDENAPRLDPAERDSLLQALLDAEERHRVDPLLLLALIERESHFRPSVRGPRGAVGLMQVQPWVARKMAPKLGIEGFRPESLYDPAGNVRVGAAYLSFLYEEFEAIDLALSAYNKGPTRLRAQLRAGNDRMSRYAKAILARREEFAAERGLRADRAESD